MTKVALIAMSAVSTSFALIGFLGWIAQAIPTDTFGILVMMSLFFSGGWWLANRGHWRVSGYIPPVFMFLAAAYGNYIGGVDAPAMLMYALTIILVAVLQGHRLQWGALALCLIAYLGIGVAHAQGYLTQLRSAETAFANRITIASAAMIAIAVLVWFLSTQYERALCQSHTLAEKAQTYAAALQEKTAELDRFFSSALDLLCIADTNGYFRRLNKEWENTLGYSLEELQGHRFLDFVHPDDVAETAKAASQLTSQKEILNFTNRYRCKDGSYRWIEWRSVPYGDRIYAAARDITERKRAEEALEKRIVALTRPLDDVSGIAFEDLFNVADIQRLQDEFADATGVASIITHPDGTPITKPSNFCRFCIGIVRKTDKGLVNCYRSDAALGRFSATGPTIQPV
jgi:PAS domain S-box-containing protein